VTRAELLEVDLGSTNGQALLAAVGARHGDAITRAAARLSRLFLLRSPWAPGLRAVGGEAQAVAHRDVHPQRFSLIGASDVLEDAVASCIAEGIERLSTAEQAGDAAALPLTPETLSRVMPAAREPIDHLLGTSQLSSTDWMTARTLGDNSETLLPADWCLRRAEQGPLRQPGTALSTGVAAGRTFDDAATRALLELIERDAAALWWIGGQRGRPLALDDPASLAAASLLATLRAEGAHRATWLLDITTDLGISCIAAVSVNGRGFDLCCGLAARLTRIEAARAAIFEMCQIELGLMLAQAKQQAARTDALAPADHTHLVRADRIDADTCALLHPSGAPRPTDAAPAPASPLDHLGEVLDRCRITAALVDLTRPEFAIPVVRAIVPQLQPMPGTRITARLARTMAATGGGSSWTGGVTLL
jgi:ribosomal protein S12 methylthiotransferase accessory factor